VGGFFADSSYFCKVDKKIILLFLLLLISQMAIQCTFDQESVSIEKKIEKKPNRRITALPVDVPTTADNPLKTEKVALGKLLFFDPILSGNKQVSCATCHHPSMGYADNIPLSIGVNGHGLGGQRVFNSPNDIPFLKRNSPTVLNTAFNGIKAFGNYDPAKGAMFWDLRVESLEAQALEPIKAFEEMRGHAFSEKEMLLEVVSRLKNIPEYQKLFKQAFGNEAEIDTILIAQAIASFERTLVTNNSRFDQYMRGDKDAISLSEKEGFALFKKAGCDNCHNGPMFSDYQIHVLGVPESDNKDIVDLGFEEGNGFRTPSLRNLNVTRPYMHNGSLSTLLRVLEFYEDISGSKMRNPNISRDELDPLVDDIEISVKDMRPIISFLNSLNDDAYDREIPSKVPSGLPVGGI
jgi:cytochrome c peroxidase